MLWLKALLFVVISLRSNFAACLCLSCWLNCFSPLVGSRKDKQRITQHRNTHQLAQLHLTHAGRAVANNAGLFSFIRPMHRCRAGPVLMKNNSSKSAVALQQPFFSVPMSPSKGTPGSRIIVPKQQSPEKPGANEAPIMIAMIKCPVMQ